MHVFLKVARKQIQVIKHILHYTFFCHFLTVRLRLLSVASQLPKCVTIGVGAQSTLGGHQIFARKICINQTVNDGVAHSKNPRKCAYIT